MQIHNIKRKTSNKKSQSVGRGGKRGKTSGRGTKGQKARAGGKLRPEIRDFIKRLPKLRGYSFNTIRSKSISVNLGVIETAFSNGESVTPNTLVEKGVINLRKGTRATVKILAGGDLTKKLTISGCLVSVGAKTKIEKAGGTVAE
ncbi:MAG: 50S ribosomal protein L15 [Candidatus Paceibacterota bacterium]